MNDFIFQKFFFGVNKKMDSKPNYSGKKADGLRPDQQEVLSELIVALQEVIDVDTP